MRQTGCALTLRRALLLQAGASFSYEIMLNPAPPYYVAMALAHGYSRIRASKTYFSVEVGVLSHSSTL
jgi:hypothetical protein